LFLKLTEDVGMWEKGRASVVNSCCSSNVIGMIEMDNKRAFILDFDPMNTL